MDGGGDGARSGGLLGDGLRGGDADDGFVGEAEGAGDFGGALPQLVEGAVELEASSFLLKARGSMLVALVLGTQSLILGGDLVLSFLT